MLCTAIAATAAEPLVQEGKTWSHKVSVNNGQGEMSSTYMTMYFGSPKEMFGKIYLPVRCTGKDFDFAYIRQEGGKVYILVDGTLHKSFSYIEDDEVLDYATGDEVLAYDFEAKPGDTYLSVSMGDMLPSGYINKWLEKVTVDKTDTILVNGIERKRQFVHTSTLPDSEYTIVEGVGCDMGLFYVPEYGPLSIGGIGSTIVKISEMSGGEGNVLFSGADFDTRACQPLVQEGKVWCGLVDFAGTGLDRRNAWKPEMYFEGKCEREGKEYSVLRTSPDDVLALMRQDGGKVYLLIDENFIGRYDIYDCTKPETDAPEKYIGKEYLVYDFDAKKGDEFNGIFYCVANDVIYLNMGLEVYDVDEISVNGQNLRRLDIPYCGFVVEGYGTQNGNCLIPQFIECCAGHDHYCDPELKMHHIIDRATREEIFTYEDFSKPSVGVEEIPAEQPSDGVQAKPKDDKMYDLNGREIRNPLPGTVYVQNGEKHVAK